LRALGGCAANGVFSKEIKMISQKDKIELKNMIKRINEKRVAKFFIAGKDCDYCS